MKQLEPLSSVAIGLAVKAIREQAKMSANDLAKQVDMTPSSLSRTENGYRILDIVQADLIAQAAGKNISDIVNLAKALEKEGHVQQREKAITEYRRSMEDVKDATAAVMIDLSR